MPDSVYRCISCRKWRDRDDVEPLTTRYSVWITTVFMCKEPCLEEYYQDLQVEMAMHYD